MAVRQWAASGWTLAWCFLVTSAEVKYVCYSRGDTTLRLRCPAGFRLLVEETRYGGSRWGACVYLEGEVGVGGACSQVAAEGRDCCGQTTCTVPSEPVYMPICGHNSDYLRVVYQCVEDTNVTCSFGLPSEATPTDSAAQSLGDLKGHGKPKDEAEAKLVLQDFRRFQKELEERSRPKKTIFGYRADTVISFFCIGTLIVLILLAILIYMYKRPNDSYKCSSVRGGAESSASDSRKEDLMESMFFDVESLSSRTPSTRSDTGAQLNDAFEIDLETTPKELMSSSEDVNSVDAIVQQDESPLPSLHSDSESSVLSLHDNGELYEETNDSGVETSPGSSDKQSQHSPTLISPSVTDNDACVDLAEEPKPGPSQENHCGSIQEKPSVCRVILDDDQDIVEC